MALEPVSRIELLAAGVQIEPISRLEKFVAAAAGTYTLPEDLKPVSRLEYFLSEISGGGGGGEGSLVKANTFLYLKNVTSLNEATYSNLRPTISGGNPFSVNGFYLKAKIHTGNNPYGNNYIHSVIGIGKTLTASTLAEASAFFIGHIFYDAATIEHCIVFQGDPLTKVVLPIDENGFSELLLTADSLTVNDQVVELSAGALTVFQNIANLTVASFHFGVKTAYRATELVLDELEMGVISA